MNVGQLGLIIKLPRTKTEAKNDAYHAAQAIAALRTGLADV